MRYADKNRIFYTRTRSFSIPFFTPFRGIKCNWENYLLVMPMIKRKTFPLLEDVAIEKSQFLLLINMKEYFLKKQVTVFSKKRSLQYFKTLL